MLMVLLFAFQEARAEDSALPEDMFYTVSSDANVWESGAISANDSLDKRSSDEKIEVLRTMVAFFCVKNSVLSELHLKMLLKASTRDF